jgi:hypothetical protein
MMANSAKEIFNFQVLVVFSVSRVNISKKSVKAKFIDTWQSYMIKELLENFFNCVDVFYPNPAVKNTNVIKQELV